VNSFVDHVVTADSSAIRSSSVINASGRGGQPGT
jgi:hypothetical protein